MLHQVEGDEKEKVTKIVVAALALGAIIALAPTIIGWLSGIDVGNMDAKACVGSSVGQGTGSSSCIPGPMVNLMKNAWTIMTIGGAFIAVGGLVLGFVKL
jgi:hypothetical protein